jgi:hypothetical protein
MTALIPTDAATRLCPLSRTFAATPAILGCRGPDCMFWRWEPISAADPRVTQAIQDRINALHADKPNVSKGLLHKEAVAWVMENRRALGIPTEPEKGFCGAAGVPT